MPPRRFDSLRPSRTVPHTTQEEPIGSLIRRHLIANADGQRILAWMQEEAGRVTPLGASEAVLREAEGKRRFVEALLQEGRPGA